MRRLVVLSVVVMLLAVALPGASSSRPLMGSSSVGAAGRALKAGHVAAFRLRARGTGTAASASVYIAPGNHSRILRVGLYNDRAGRPSRLLGSGTTTNVRTAAWVTIPLRPTPVVQGRRYWLAILSVKGTLHYRVQRRNGCTGATSAERAEFRLPHRWKAARSQSSCPIAAYVSAGHGQVLLLPPPPGGGPAPTSSSPTPTPPGLPAPLPPAGSSNCTTTVSTSAAADSAIQSARGGAVICLAAGTYPGLDIMGTHSADVTVQPVPGATVTLNAGPKDLHGEAASALVEPGASHVIIHGFYTQGMIELENGDDSIWIDHNDITGGYYGILLSSWNCSWANAITWSGCTNVPMITNTIISGNYIHDFGTVCNCSANSEDPMFLQNIGSTRITGNEIAAAVEHGNHTDCLGETNDGEGPLIVDHNYEHDNNCQGLFPGKSGDMTQVVVYDNLFVRDQVANEPEANMNIFNTYNLLIRNNTSWPQNGDQLRVASPAQPVAATVDHNVFDSLTNGGSGDTGQYALTESYNIFRQGPTTFKRSSTDSVGTPAFISPSTDDYRLANNPNGIGIDWRPADQHYGP